MSTMETKKIVPLAKHANYEGGKNTAGLYVGNAHHITLVLVSSAQGDANTQVETKCGTGEATFAAGGTIKPTVYGSENDIEAVGADIYDEVAYEAGEDYWKIPADDDRVYVMEVPASMITDGRDWLRVEISGDGATNADLNVLAIVYPRYAPAETMVKTA